MKLRYTIALLFAGVLIALLAGCSGSSTALNPTVTFTFPDDTTLPTMRAGTLLKITGEIEATGEGDSIKSCVWTQVTEAPGVFSITDGPETTWRAPAWAGPGELPVTLALTVKTLLGGETTKHIQLRIVP